MWRADGSPYDKHLQNPGQKCNKHAKFTIIEKKMSLSQKVSTHP